MQSIFSKKLSSVGARFANLKCLRARLQSRQANGWLLAGHDNSSLPNHFQGELHISRLGGQSIHFAVSYNRPCLVKDPSAVDWLRRIEVGVIENIEDFRPELDIHGFRNAMDREVLQYGEIHIDKFRTNDRISPRITQ